MLYVVALHRWIMTRYSASRDVLYTSPPAEAETDETASKAEDESPPTAADD